MCRRSSPKWENSRHFRMADECRAKLRLSIFSGRKLSRRMRKISGGKTNAAGAVLGLRDWLGLPASGTDPGAPEITFWDALAQFRLIEMLNRFDATWEAGEGARHDPIVELSDLHFSIACGTISHVAIEMGYGERAEQLLQRHCFNQFRLLLISIPLSESRAKCRLLQLGRDARSCLQGPRRSRIAITRPKISSMES